MARAVPKPSATLRAFISIEPPDELRKQIAALQKSLDATLKSEFVKWTNPKQIHLTLRFIGEMPEADAKKVLTGMRKACKEFKPFHLHLGGLGAFPDIQRPSILWTGVSGDVEALKSLVNQINHEISGVIGMPELQQYMPHLTIGRVKELPAAKLKRLTAACLAEPLHLHGCVDVKSVRLMKSALGKSGAVHTAVGEVKLG